MTAPVEAIRAFYAAQARGDTDAMRASVSDDLVWHVPGRNPVSGDYHGAGRLLGEMVERMAPLDEWRFELESVMWNEAGGLGLALVRLHGLRKGYVIETRAAHALRVDGDGRITEAWGFVEDQDGLDAFFAA